jgi:outer membrane protein OmpA-like peptidoglycan-associated protein
MVRKAAFFLIVSLLCQLADGQNLVANPSFEDVNICSEFHQPCSPSAWWFVNRTVTSGYFPRYPSATGERHLQIVAASRQTSTRQYWETMLLCPLQAGEKYIIDLKVASLKEHPNLRDIGFWFNDRFVFSKLDTLLQPRTYLRFTDAKMKDLKNGWFEISKEFTPSRNASFLIIGNFVGLSNADILDQRQKPEGSIEIGVDDIVITAVKAPLCPGYEKRKDSLYSITRRHSEGGPDEPGDDTDTRTVPPAHDTVTPITPPPAAKTDTLIIRNIQFGFDRYLVDNPDTLLRYKQFLTRPDIKKVRVVGFTDDKGSESYNQQLSEKRAQEVGRLLTTRFGIPASIIEPEGRGISHEFKDSNLNRRVEIYIFH